MQPITDEHPCIITAQFTLGAWHQTQTQVHTQTGITVHTQTGITVLQESTNEIDLNVGFTVMPLH